MFLLCESIKYMENRLYNIDYHNARMNNARKALFNDASTWDLQSLIQVPILDADKIYKCRFLYNRDNFEVEFVPYTRRNVRTLKLVHSNDIEYQYKYVDRTVLDKIKQENNDYDDVVYVKDNHITDCSFANLVFYDGSRWITPSTPLLKGTKRQRYIDQGIVREGEVLVSNLGNFTKVRYINAMIDIEESNDVVLIR